MPILRLLHTESLQFQVFGSSCNAKTRPPKYAILSHVWLKSWDGHQEIVFNDMEKVPPKERSQIAAFEGVDWSREKTSKRLSHAKILHACGKAASHGIEWIWIDNCCINKSDIAETAEAINSMFTWYSNAAMCIVYLADVSGDVFPSRDCSIEWFTRGWTLQELLASGWDSTEFFNSSWERLGTKASLSVQIEIRTGISTVHLLDYSGACAAVKLSWASGRETSLIEDRAYSLLGLFDVQIDVRYGAQAEKHAFRWLQEAIVNQTQDESIFAWTCVDLVSHGMLAPSIECFRHCNQLTVKSHKRKPRHRNAYSMSKGALLFHVPMDARPFASLLAILQSPLPSNLIDPTDLVRLQRSKRQDCALTLNCWRTDANNGPDVACVRLAKKEGSDCWQRVNCAELTWANDVKAVAEKRRINRVDLLVIADNEYT